MVPDVSEDRLMVHFFEGIKNPLHQWFKDFNLTNLQDALWKTRYLVGATEKNKFTPRPPLVPR